MRRKLLWIFHFPPSSRNFLKYPIRIIQTFFRILNIHENGSNLFKIGYFKYTVNGSSNVQLIRKNKKLKTNLLHPTHNLSQEKPYILIFTRYFSQHGLYTAAIFFGQKLERRPFTDPFPGCWSSRFSGPLFLLVLPDRLREKRANRSRLLAFPREAIQFYEYCWRAPLYNSRRATTRIVGNVARFQRCARICKRYRHSTLLAPLSQGKRTALFPRINQANSRGARKQTVLLTRLCRVASFFSFFPSEFSIEIEILQNDAVFKISPMQLFLFSSMSDRKI